MHVLIAENDENLLKRIEDHISKSGFEVTLAADSGQAMDALVNPGIDLMVGNWSMLDAGGLKLFNRIRAIKPDRFFYLIAFGAQTEANRARCDWKGILDDFIVNPLNISELEARMAVGIRVLTLENELNQKVSASQRNFRQTVQLLSHFIDTYDPILGSHCRRVGQFALDLANHHPDIPGDALPTIETAGLLHDIGLIGLPKALLAKQRTEWNGEEADLFRSHSERGEQLLLKIEILAPIAPIVRSHHEQFNGRGFPDGLSGELIPYASKIIAAANIYDNLIHRRKIMLKDMPEHLQQFRGYQLSADVVELLLEINLARMAEESNHTDRLVHLSELWEGMVLARDLQMKTGAFVMSEGTRLDSHIIDKLKRYLALGNITDKVFVKK
jgi:response regulator RpfG family c-di-GMP phosphodiesterase